MPHLLQELVMEFHKTMGCSIGDVANPDVTQDVALRMALIDEERNELDLAIQGYKRAKDGSLEVISGEAQIHAVADALADLAYVIQGAAIVWGIPLPDCIEAVHQSNMTKTPGNSRVDGKILKGPNYREPDLKAAFEQAKADIGDAGYGDESWWPEPRKSLRDQIEADRRNALSHKVCIPKVEVACADPDRFVFALLKDKSERDRLPDQDPGDES